jgi:hypothetical protein
MSGIDDMMFDQEEHEKKLQLGDTTQKKEIENMFDEPQPKEQEAQEEPVVTESEAETPQENKSIDGKVLIGKVERFFSKINVAAIKLTGDIKLGDVLEIRDDSGAIKLTVLSMQIEKQDVGEASAGDSIGIKVDQPVNTNSDVYLIN